MNCGNVKELINNIIDNNDAEGCNNDLFKHLAECHDCAHFFNTIVDLKREIKNDAVEFPKDLDEKVFDKIDRLRFSKKKKYSFNLFWKKDLSIPLPIGIAFSMLLIILCLVSLNYYNKSHETILRNASMTQYENTSDKVIVIYGMPEILIKDKPLQGGAKNVNNNYKIQ